MFDNGDKLTAYAEARLIPLNVMVELTYRCNTRCVHCYVVPDKGREELSTAELLLLLDDLAEAGCLFLTFTGGEAMLRPDFWELVRAAADRHFALQVFVNGNLVDEAAARRFAELNVVTVGISLYGASPEIHEGVTRLPGSYERTIKAIHLLRQAGLNVLLKHVVMQQNKDEYPAIFKLADELGVAPQIDPIVVPANDGSLKPTTCRLPEAELMTVLGDKLVNPEIVRYEGKGMPELCAAGRCTCNINPYGDVTPCIQLLIKAGNIRKQRFTNIWQDALAFKMIRSMKPEDITACGRCNLRPYCFRCPGLALLEDGDLFGPSRVACKQAGIFKELYAEQLKPRGAYEEAKVREAIIKR